MFEGDVEFIASEIMEYLQRRPLASDTLEGITHWWLVQQAIVRNTDLVERALEQLAHEGKVSKKMNATSEAVYRLNPLYKSARE